jgi:hypothetical protein
VTAKHVVESDGFPREHLLICPLGTASHRAKLIYAHPLLDLALVQCEGFRVETPLFPSYERFTGKGGLICLGFAPSLGRDDRKSHMFVNRIEAYDREVRAREGLDEEMIMFDAPFMEGGHSGGPTLGEGGGVVAVTIEGYGSDRGFRGRATAIHPIMDRLRVS